MISQIVLQVANKQILFMVFPKHLSMVEITEVEYHGFKVAFDPCQLRHVFPDEGMNRFRNFDDPETIDSLKAMARVEYFYGAN